MVKGTLESEFLTRFCPMRFTYSVTTGSCTSLTPCSTCCEYCCPIATCFSREYQFPAPVLQPTLRLPMASRFFKVVGLGAFLSGLDGCAESSGAEAGGAVCVAGALWVCGELGELCVGYPCAAAEAEATSRARANTPNCLNENCIFTPWGTKSRASSASTRGPAVPFQ